MLNNMLVYKGQVIVDFNKLADKYTKAEIDAMISSVFVYKGTVATYDDLLAIQNPKVGDCYNVQADDHNYAWNGTAWDKLAGVIDLSDYYTSSQVDSLIAGLRSQISSLNVGVLSINNELPDSTGNIDINKETKIFYHLGETFTVSNDLELVKEIYASVQSRKDTRVIIYSNSNNTAQVEYNAYMVNDSLLKLSSASLVDTSFNNMNNAYRNLNIVTKIINLNLTITEGNITNFTSSSASTGNSLNVLDTDNPKNNYFVPTENWQPVSYGYLIDYITANGGQFKKLPEISRNYYKIGDLYQGYYYSNSFKLNVLYNNGNSSTFIDFENAYVFVYDISSILESNTGIITVLALGKVEKGSDITTSPSIFSAKFSTKAGSSQYVLKITSFDFSQLVNQFIMNSSDADISGKYTFETLPESSVTPTKDEQLVPKSYVDEKIPEASIQIIDNNTNGIVLSDLALGDIVIKGLTTSLSVILKATSSSTALTITPLDNRFSYLKEISSVTNTEVVGSYIGNNGIAYYISYNASTQELSTTQALSSSVLNTSDSQNVSGLKTFTTLPQSSLTPTNNNDLVNKSYVDSTIQSYIGDINAELATLVTL